jgi:nitrile hydratase beta subunit
MSSVPARRTPAVAVTGRAGAGNLGAIDGVHDMAGMHGFGPVVEPGGELVFHSAWEPRIFALHLLVSLEGLGAGPGGRATREQMPPADYLAASYYERWLWSAERRLERGGTIVPGEVDRMVARLADGAAPPEHSDPSMSQRALAALRTPEPMFDSTDARFAPGERVRVARMHPPGHTRCPRYVRGVLGQIRSIRGADALPDRPPEGEHRAPEPVYSVAFDSLAVWGTTQEPGFVILLDLWQSYLEAA